jgi:aspartyl-tRNA(Asn)/glutamyl-tRNA(Gln) amidotransferase subunit B
MEEDTGKTTHGSESGRIHEAAYALIDYNRAGVPLVECVSEPDMRTPEEAATYLRELRATLEVLDVSDVKMEEGSLRCDANISIRPSGSEVLGTKVEIKNMNSIRSLERALLYEEQRQIHALEVGEHLVQETRHWDEGSGMTTSMRSKEEAFDYRYFPEPDIPPLEPSEGWIEEIRATLPELPRARRARYEALGLRSEVVRVLVADRTSVVLFEGAVAVGADPAPAATWITQDVAALRNAAGAEGALTAGHVADIVRLVADGTISGAGAKVALEDAFASGAEIPELVDRLQLRQVSDAGALGALADEVIHEHPDVVEKFRGGKDGVIGFLVGQLMQKAGGAANPKVAQELLRERLQG